MEMPLELRDLYSIINLSKRAKDIKELSPTDLELLKKLEGYVEKELQDFEEWKLKQKANK